MKSLDDKYVPANMTSVELANSSTPLPNRHWVTLNMAEYTVYSKTLDKELELVSLNGLPALRLYPGDENLEALP